ncbi:MAG TPA: aldehyde dehydrogenase family protein [Trueperaceae bacterium]|nr:aldehyde dehydrogenase family protein [Trueperaceae bacterium]
MMSVREIFNNMEYGPAPESATIAEAWLANNKNKFDNFINAKFVKPSSNEYFETINPATGEVLARVAKANDKDVDKAVKAARKAFKDWSTLPAHKRARYLYAIARHIQKHSRLLSVIETLDNGKPIRETRDIDIPLVARHFYYHAGWAELADEFDDYEALGVAGQIIPWNFPLLMLAWKIAPALAAGNTVVLKPAELTPLSAMLFAQICQEVGLPAGVVNIVNGYGDTGAHIVEHPDIDKIAFTGSTEVGRIIRKATAGSGKKLSLELGGKSPFIVFEDADIESAIEGVVDAIYFNQGQVCCAGSRLLVQEGIAKEFHEKLKIRMAKLRVGNPLDKAIDIGAIIDPVQLERISGLCEIGKSEGSICWQPEINLPKKGSFFLPTLFENVSPASVVAQEEIFGPVLVSMTFRMPSEAVELANNTRYGLAASVWTESVNLALDIAPKIKSGIVWVNSTNLFDAAAGFGGYKESGFGREGGKEGMYEYLKLKWQKDLKPVKALGKIQAAKIFSDTKATKIDRTPKMYIAGKQKRPDSGYSYPILNPNGELVGEAGLGNRKDIRNAVEAARKASAWGKATAHNRAQVLYFIAENLSARADEFKTRLQDMTGVSAKKALEEVEKSIERIFYYAAYADKYDGAVHSTPIRNVTLAMLEPFGILAISAPVQNPLLSFVSLVMPAIAMGNRVVVSPSELYPLAATDLYQVFDTSDLPAGVVNIITGKQDELADTMAKHDEIAAMWYFGSQTGSELVERESIGNLKATWVNNGKEYDFFSNKIGQGKEYLRRATQVKNIWVPYGE